MKGITCVDGRKQPKKQVPGDTTPPTFSTWYILITATIDTHEGPGIEICNTPGAFISADTEEHIKMALHGSLSEVMVKLTT